MITTILAALVAAVAVYAVHQWSVALRRIASMSTRSVIMEARLRYVESLVLPRRRVDREERCDLDALLN